MWRNIARCCSSVSSFCHSGIRFEQREMYLKATRLQHQFNFATENLDLTLTTDYRYNIDLYAVRLTV